MVKEIDHIGIVVRDIESSLKIYTDALGIKLYAVEENETFKVKIAFLPVGDTLVELLEPVGDETMIADFLKDRGEGIHHIAFKVNDLERTLDKLKRMKVPLIDEEPKPGGLGARVAFLHPSAANSVAIELLEKEDRSL